MKKLILLCIFTIVLFSSGCASKTSSSQEDSLAFQEASDRSSMARDFAQTEFDNSMKEQKIEYTIEQTAYGFILHEIPTFLVAFQYTSDNKIYYYGYKISVDDNYYCTLKEEGASIAELVFK